MAKPYPYFVSLDEARKICQNNKISLSTEEVSIDDSLNRIIASNVVAKVNDPPFDNSAMDGFAVIFSETTSKSVELSIIGVSNAGSKDLPKLSSGQAMKIMTGAPIPEGADSIIPIEKCVINGEKVTLNEQSKPHFIRKQGENFTKNSVLFEPGEILTPEKISLCAAAGVNKLTVYQKLKVAIIPTGDELKPLNEELSYGDIYESNSYGLSALITSLGHEATRFPTVVDNLETLRETLNLAAKDHDLIITSGGVSMGDRDFVRIIMQNEGEINFWRVKMRPGSPPIFGRWASTPIFGLPGNPVSSHVVFRVIVMDWLMSSTNSKNPRNQIITATLDNDIKVVEGFTTFRRVELFHNQGKTIARLKGHQGSGNIAGIAMSDGLTILGPEANGKQGDNCQIMLF
ncbi:MAG: molybdopterin molybdotransferase MoeA [Candidatus Poseidoniaceae archaeon]|nr:molybdopterin molybdotransferase MoeA [Candidatus Poseidoniaceae archaeon]